MHSQEAEFLKGLRAHLADDHTGLWEVRRLAQQATGVSEEEPLRDFVLPLLRDLLARHELVAGFPTSDGRFVAWSGVPDETVERIRREWMEMGRPPDIGEIVWFTRPGPRVDS